MQIGLPELKQLVMGPLRDYILEYEGTDWCCRQSALYVTYVARALGHPAVVLEGPVTIETNAPPGRMIVNHAWTVLPEQGNLLIDLMLTQANWLGGDLKPIRLVEPIWGNDPAHVSREVNRVWSKSTTEDLLTKQHWQKPAIYKSICLEMLDCVRNHVALPYVAI